MTAATHDGDWTHIPPAWQPRAPARPFAPASPANDAVLAAAFEHAPSGIALVAADGRFLRVNCALRALLGSPEPELLATTLPALAVDPVPDLPAFARRSAAGVTWLEARLRHRRGHPVWASLGLALLPGDGEPTFVAHVVDIGERKAAEARLQALALSDPLTGLPNRTCLLDRLARAVDAAGRGAPPPAVLYLDLDGFKAVNDAHGHAGGDRALLLVADRLRAAVRPGDLVARLGGDEFVVLLEGLGATEEADRIAPRLAAHLAAPLCVDGVTISLTASVGVARYSPTHRDHAAFLRDADAAMYRAKGARPSNSGT